MKTNHIYHGDALTILKTLPNESVNCCLTSPPYYGLRDYGIKKQLGLEKTPEEYIEKLVDIFRQVKRILKKEGTLWLNISDTYWGSGCGTNDYRTPASQSLSKHYKEAYSTNPPQKSRKHSYLKPKDMCMIPARVAIALQQDGWWLRNDCIWAKPNGMPESCTDRFSKAHEYIFLFSKSAQYYFDQKAVSEPTQPDGRKDTKFKGSEKYENSSLTFHAESHERWPHETKNGRTVWHIPTESSDVEHFAVMPQKVALRCILGGCPEEGIVLDPFFGAGTSGLVALKTNRKFVGIELNGDYIKKAQERIKNHLGLFI